MSKRPAQLDLPEQECVHVSPCGMYESHFSLMLVLSVLWDAAWTQPQRSPSEFFCRPLWPIQEVYITRLLVNLLWFARNYLNLAFAGFIIVIFLFPPYALILAGSAIIHYTKRLTFGRTTNASLDVSLASGEVETSGENLISVSQSLERREGSLLVMFLITLHGICCLTVCWITGLAPFITLIVAVTTPVISHALLTPYHDDAFELYCNVLRKSGIPPPVPRSPTYAFHAVDPAFDTIVKKQSSPRHRHRQANAVNGLRHSFTSLTALGKSKLQPSNSGRIKSPSKLQSPPHTIRFPHDTELMPCEKEKNPIAPCLSHSPPNPNPNPELTGSMFLSNSLRHLTLRENAEDVVLMSIKSPMISSQNPPATNTPPTDMVFEFESTSQGKIYAMPLKEVDEENIMDKENIMDMESRIIEGVSESTTGSSGGDVTSLCGATSLGRSPVIDEELGQSLRSEKKQSLEDEG